MQDVLFQVKQLYADQQDDKWIKIKQLCHTHWDQSGVDLQFLYYALIAQLIAYEQQDFDGFLEELSTAISQSKILPTNTAAQARYWRVMNDNQIVMLAKQQQFASISRKNCQSLSILLKDTYHLSVQWLTDSQCDQQEPKDHEIDISAARLDSQDTPAQPPIVPELNSALAVRGMHQQFTQYYSGQSQWLAVILLNRAYRWSKVVVPKQAGELSVEPPGAQRLASIINLSPISNSIDKIEGLFLEAGGWALLDLQCYLHECCLATNPILAPWVLTLTKQFTEQHPQLLDCFFKNKLPCASDKTKRWLNSHVKIDNCQSADDNHALPLSHLISVQHDLHEVQQKILALMPT